MAMQDTDVEDTSPIWLYDLRVVNKRRQSGVVALAKADVRVGGICVKDMHLMRATSGELWVSAPWGVTRPEDDRAAVQIKCRLLRERITAKFVQTYRMLAAERGKADLTQPEHRQGVAA